MWEHAPGNSPAGDSVTRTPLLFRLLRFAQHVVARSRQLVRQSLGRQDAIALALLAFIEALGLRAVAPGEVRRLDEGPGEVLVAVLGIAFTFLLVVALA